MGRNARHILRYKQGGFTIVELLIVVVVIAILAAITVVSYNGISNRAKDAALRSTTEQAAKKISLYFTTNGDTYPATLLDVAISDSGSTTYEYTVDNGASPKTFCVTVTTGSLQYYSSSTSLTPTSGACPGHTGGVPLLTNLAINPKLGANANDYSFVGSMSGVSRVPISDLPGFSYAYQGTVSAAGDRLMLIDMTNSLVVGQQYTASAYAKLTAGISFYMQVTDGIGGNSSFSPAVTATGSWQRLSRTFTATAATSRVNVRLNTAGIGTLQMTGVMITDGPTLYTYADGGSSGWSWSGSAENSSSSGPQLP